MYLPDYYNVVNLVTKQAKEKGITAAFMGGDGWDSADLDRKAAEGGYYSLHYSPDDQRPGKSADIPEGVWRQVQGWRGKTHCSGRRSRVSITDDAQHNPVKGAVMLHIKGGEGRFRFVPFALTRNPS